MRLQSYRSHRLCGTGLWEVILLLAAISISGCGNQVDSTNAKGSTRDLAAIPKIPAADYLKQVLSRYRNARSYSDQGEVRLRIDSGGRVSTETAPMQVILDGSLIWVAAYDAKLWSDREKLFGWIADEDNDFHDSQVLQSGAAGGRSVERPDLDVLLKDPILRSRMTAGLAGPPPQLEWLLDPDPMARLFHNPDDPGSDPHQQKSIEYDGVAKTDDVTCVIVNAIDGRDRYRFWIESSRSIIHRVELPTALNGVPITFAEGKVESLELILRDASFEAPPSPIRMSDMPNSELPSRPKFVSRLIPLPPREPDRRIGMHVSKFGQADITGNIRVDHRGADRPISLWYICESGDAENSDPQNLDAIRFNSMRLQQLQKANRDQVRPICLADKQSSRAMLASGMSSAGWLLVQDEENQIRRAIGVKGGQSALIDSQGCIIWIASNDRPQEFAAIEAIIQDAAAGVDVPRQFQESWRAGREAYRQQLDEASVQ